MQPAKPHPMPPDAVAIIGAGPAGLVAARWLKEHGLSPVLFECADQVGGQWNPRSPASATWRGMRTNTSRIMTAFSDLDHLPGVPVHPRREDILAYLGRYADTFGLGGAVRPRTRVEHLAPAPGGGWLVRTSAAGAATEEVFRRVIVATGRQAAPAIPAIPGLGTFAGALGAAHTSGYDGAERYRGRHVVVAGCSVSALEIAADLALSGAAAVTAAYRRQRFVLPKLVCGVPTDHVMFTRAAALLGAALPPEALAEGLRAQVLRVAGSPGQVGAPEPHPDILAAGLTQSQHFLPAVAEGRIEVRPWIERVDGRTVRFADGSRCEADALLLGTGYRLHLPFLAQGVADALGLDGQHIDLCDHTFHPALPGLAFLGLYDQAGPLFPVLELQARWVAYAFAGLVAMPSGADLAAGIAACRARRGGPQAVPMNAMALLFARNAGVEPDLARWPALERALLFGPLSPGSFRLQGPDSLPDAPERTSRDAAAFGAVAGAALTPEEVGVRDLLLPRDRAA